MIFLTSSTMHLFVSYVLEMFILISSSLHCYMSNIRKLRVIQVTRLGEYINKLVHCTAYLIDSFLI